MLFILKRKGKIKVIKTFVTKQNHSSRTRSAPNWKEGEEPRKIPEVGGGGLRF